MMASTLYADDAYLKACHEELESRSQRFEKPTHAIEMQGDIPVYHFTDPEALKDPLMREEISTTFFDGPGCIILKHVFEPEVMQEYNTWCEEYLKNPFAAKNHTHPKQADKFVINSLLERLSEEKPDLLMRLMNDPVYIGVLDSLLGFATVGAFTTHWIKPFGDRQETHVDYPMHVGSGKFWEASPDKMMRLTTDYQLNHMLNRYSVQALTASDAMDVSNGSTEVVPYSHHLNLVDLKVHDPSFKAFVQPRFVNVNLDQGDVLIFNRRLVHRGGKNLSNKRRNSCIAQWVWLWGVGQHAINAEQILTNFVHSSGNLYNELSDEALKDFHLRLKKPYPLDTTVTY